MKTIKFALIFSIMISSFSAMADVLNFENLKKSDDSFTFFNGDYEESGYILTAENPDTYSFATAGDLNPRYAGSTALTTFNLTKIYITSTSGINFNFLSLDVAPVNLGANDFTNVNRDLNSVYQTSIIGLRKDGSSVEQIITIPNTSIINVFKTVQLNGFTDLNQVVIYNDKFPGIQFDNLVLNTVSSVPEPSNVMLLLTGLLVLAAVKSRREHI